MARRLAAWTPEHFDPNRRILKRGGQVPEQTFKESFKVAADQLVDALKKIIHEGNVRRVVIKQEGRTIVEFPITVGVVGTVFAPMLAAAGALAAVLTECTIEVERGASNDKEGAA
jgi:hypothetical protein